MAQLKKYNTKGTESGTVELLDSIFDVDPSASLVHEVIVAQEANSRVVRGNTKDRSEVAGTGKKPWKQKGTGRARHGSRRSPIWIGGGITFGPTLDRVFGKKVNKKARRKALLMMLTDKLREDRLVIVDSFKDLDAKTKSIVALRKALPGSDGSALLATTPEERAVALGASNIPKTQAISILSLNVRDLSKFKFLILSEEGLAKLTETYSL